MKAVVTVLQELYGLFVDDGSLAVGLLVWVAVAAFAFRLLPGATAWRAPVLFLGVLAIVLENALRSARARRK